MGKKIFIKIRLCNLATYVLNWHFKIVKMSMVKCNAPILNKLKIMGFYKRKVNT